jgi:hypothetical protein
MRDSRGNVHDALQATFTQLDKRFLASSAPAMVRASRWLASP